MELIQLFNWWRRYRVRAVDMTQLQRGLLDSSRGPWEGLASEAVLDGFDLAFTGGLGIDVQPGIAVGPSGYLEGVTGTTSVALTTPIGNPSRSLLVVRPLVTYVDPITNPVSPFNTVYLHQNLEAEVVLLPGAPASPPVYPFGDMGPNDVIIAGIRLAAAATSVDANCIDYDFQDIPGKATAALQSVGLYDNRMRAYESSTGVLGITPSQPTGAANVGLAYAGGAKALAFPLTGGVFTQQDALLNMKTGAITGGDGDSPNFTPTTPAAGKSIWAVVTVSTTSLLAVAYGTQGTYAQCKAAMRSQVSSGAGAVPATAAAKVCFVLLSSSDGVNINEKMEIVDARGPGNFASSNSVAITSVNHAISPYTMDGTETHIEIDASGGTVTVNLPDRASNQGKTFPIDRIDSSANAVSVVRSGADTIDDPISTTTIPLDSYQSQDFFAGSTKWKVRG